jgi:hypothetical protein
LRVTPRDQLVGAAVRDADVLQQRGEQLVRAVVQRFVGEPELRAAAGLLLQLLEPGRERRERRRRGAAAFTATRVMSLS